MPKQPYGKAKTPFTLKSGNKIAFKMMGNSPMKQDVGIQTGFGPEADANLKKKINIKTGTSKPVAKKAVKKGLWKGAKKLMKKAFLPLTIVDAAINLPKLKEKHGVKKFVGGMLWDKHMFLSKSERKGGGTGDHVPSKMEKELKSNVRKGKNPYASPKY